MKKGLETKLQRLALKIKKDTLTIAYDANVGHIGSAFSIIEILTFCYGYAMNITSKNVKHNKRDRFILSKGHAASALYSVLHNFGFVGRKDLKSYCKDGGRFGTHPVYDPKIGIDFSTGSLGHGLSVGVGMALGYRLRKASQKVFVLISDAELNEGSTWEAIMFAAHHKLDNLVCILDNNSFQAFGRTSDVIKIESIDKKIESFGWVTRTVNGHSISELINAYDGLSSSVNKPKIIIAETVTAKGIEFLEDKLEAHYMPLKKSEFEKTIKRLKS